MSKESDPHSADEIFLHARQLRGEEREKYLNDVCAKNSALRSDVDRMLRADEDPTDLHRATPEDDQREFEVPDKIGHYRIERELGSGRYGRVFLGRHLEVEELLVAIKIPRPDSLVDAEQFVSEARNLAAATHPNIVKLHDFGRTGSGQPYAVYEFIAGGSLAARIKSSQFDHTSAVVLILKMARALTHVHAKGIYHRDVKPANILLDTEGEPRLADFGIAISESDWTLTNDISGTPEYMSPEQARGEAQVDGRSDLFSLGAVLYELLTGKVAFAGSTIMEILSRVQTKDPQPLRELDPSIAPELQRICLKALAKATDERYQTAADFVGDLEHFLETEANEDAGHAQPQPKSRAESAVDAPVLLGEFELRSILGSGGMAVVYRARQSGVDRDVALKCVRLGDSETEARFQREIKALGKVKHPNLVAIHSSGVEAGHSYYSMDLIDGADLTTVCQHLTRSDSNQLDDDTWKSALTEATDEIRARERPVKAPVNDKLAAMTMSEMEPILDAGSGRVRESDSYVRRIVDTIQQITGAVQALHDEGIIHRDIKPGNIMLARDGSRATLMDLGIASMENVTGERLTRTRKFVGTLRYASPEQVLAVGDLDHRSDVYSLGVTLWELLTLRPMFGARRNVKDSQIIHKIEYDEPEPVRKYNRAVPSDLEAIMQKCLEKNPSRRYESAGALGEDLRRVLQGDPVAVRPVGFVARSLRSIRRRPLVPGLVTAIVLLLVLGTIAILRPNGEKPHPRDNGIPGQVSPEGKVMTVGIKGWIGYAPLYVANELGLYGSDLKLQFVPVDNVLDARDRVHHLGDRPRVDVGMWLVDTHPIALSEGNPAVAVLKLDVSLDADAMIAPADINEFTQLKGKKIAFQPEEPSHTLLLVLCEDHGVAVKDIRWVEADADVAVTKFVDGEVDAAVSYDPYLQTGQAKMWEQKGIKVGRPFTGKSLPEDSRIVDILVVREDYLTYHRPRVKMLIKGWFEAVALLQDRENISGRHEEAVASARRFLDEYAPKDEFGTPYTDADYYDMTLPTNVLFAGPEDNRAFFELDESGSSRFRRQVSAARHRWPPGHVKTKPFDPFKGDGDGSDVLLEALDEMKEP